MSKDNREKQAKDRPAAKTRKPWHRPELEEIPLEETRAFTGAGYDGMTMVPPP
ncbi:MAG: hypothetical protein HQ559_07555 [Lentisphaerae bacterium]|nr:hypothetical protein [Lentisphaerota bacterium]